MPPRGDGNAPDRNNPYRVVYLYERRALPVYAMVLLAAAAAAAVAANTPSRASAAAPVSAEATATVRIVAGVRLNLHSDENPDAPRAHDSTIVADGNPRPARLIEFE
jgi:hypothetical protein